MVRYCVFVDTYKDVADGKKAGFTFDKMLHPTPDNTFDIIIEIHIRAPFRLIC
jgi:hypothetical protein